MKINNFIRFFLYVFYFLIFLIILYYFQTRTNAGIIKFDYINKPNKVKIFCMILTVPQNYKTGKSQTILNIWANRCDNYKFVSHFPNNLKNEVSNKSESLEFDPQNIVIEPEDLKKENYNQLTDKVYSSFKHIYKYFNNYDWYLKADDDTFIEIDNLKNFLSDKNPKDPVTFGYDYKVIVKQGYHSGGAGYVLSNEALKRLGSKLIEDKSYCGSTGVEDVDVATCLRKLDVYMNSSIDNLGRERFHPLNIEHSYEGLYPDWLYQYASNPLKKDIECCSDSFISFHYMSKEEMIRLNTVIQRLENVLNKNNSKHANPIKPKFKDIIENYFKFEKLEKEMLLVIEK